MLIIRFSSLGDVILSSVILQPLYENGFSVDFLTLKPYDQLFLHDHRVNKVIGIDKESIKSVKNLIHFARSLRYDYILDIHKNVRSFLITFFSGGRVFRYNKRSISRRMGILYKDYNVLKAYLEILKNLNISDVSVYKPNIILKDFEIQGVRKFLPEKFISISTGARYKNKVYPFYSEVCDILIKKGYNVILVGSKEDRDMDENVYSDKVLDLRGKLSLRESLAVISQGILTISNDSAVAHMSRAVNVPVLMIYGPTHPYYGFAPLPDEGDYIFKGIDCQPCDLHGKRECKRGDLACLRMIHPQEVIEKSLMLIR